MIPKLILPAVLALSAHAADLQIVTSALPAATAGIAYNQPLAVTGGNCSVTNGVASSTIDSGALPPGLSVFSPAGTKSWTIQGAPSAGGTFQFVLHIRWTHNGVSPFDPNCTDDATKPLSITVTSPLTVDRSQVSATYHIAHFPPASESVRVSAQGSAAVSFTAQTATSNGGAWLSVSPTSGVTPATLSLSFSVSGLAAGVYSGTVTLSSGGANATAIAVTLTVVADTGIVLKAEPASLAFSFATGGAVPAPQTLSISAAGDIVLFFADINAPPNGKWLSVTPAGAATTATLSVSVDPKGLAPGTYSGAITLHLAGLTSIAQTIPVNFTITTAPSLPAITQNGVVNAASLTAAIAPGTWVSIFGANLSATTRPWRGADFVGDKLPSSLDGVSVTINSRPAAVAFVSPTQINVLAPDDTTTGLVFVQVKAPTGTSDTVLALQQTAAPAFFQFRAPAAVYAAGTHADGSYLAGPALVQQGIAGTPAKPGETIVLYGTGFGATQPLISAGVLVPAALPLANVQDLRIRIGGVDAAIAFAGLISPGLYQFNVVVPNVGDGDRSVVAELRGLLTRSDLVLTVQR